MTRALATVVRLDEVRPHSNADALEVAQVRGWQIVVRKGEFKTGDFVVYFEIDSALPVKRPSFSFLADRSTRVFNDTLVHVLRTIKLRGEYSQGLVLSITEFPEVDSVLGLGEDVTEVLGIELWEPPLSGQNPNSGMRRVSTYPTHIAPKTDAERVQNLPLHFFENFKGYERFWVATEKIDGSSATFARDEDGTFIVASHHMSLDPHVGEHIWNQIAGRYDFEDWLAPGVTVQGEIYGEGIQKNPLGLKGIHFAVFAIWYEGDLIPRDRWGIDSRLLSVPVTYLPFPLSRVDALIQVDGWRSYYNPDKLAEGVVWTYYGPDIEIPATRIHVDSETGAEYEHTFMVRPLQALGQRPCFKVISNAYLAKQKD